MSAVNDPSRGSPERFGYEWDKYSEIVPQYEDQFRRWLPFYGLEYWAGKRFLDVGCGMGRNSYWPMTYGAVGGYAIDLDERSLAAARRNLISYPTVEVHAVGAYEIPWRDDLDIAYCIGVLHHLEFPDKALVAMKEAVRSGGEVAIWVYGRENNGWFLWALSPARKLLFSWMPVSWVHAVAVLPTALLWILLRMGLNKIDYFRLLRTFSFRHLWSIVFDQMLPKIANYWSEEEVRAFMKGAELDDIELAWVNEMSWAARGRKPVGDARDA